MLARIMVLIALALAGATFYVGATAKSDHTQDRTIAPFIDNSTFIVARFDLSRPDSDELAFVMPSIERFLNMNSALYSTQVKELFGSLRKAGAKEFFAIYGFFGTLPAYVIPLKDGASEKGIQALFGALSIFRDVRCERMGDAMVFGNHEVMQHYRERKPVARPELASAFSNAADASCQLAIALSPDVRRTFEELIPKLPKEFGEGPSTLLSRDLQWASVALSVGPKKSLNLAVQASDEAAAGRLQTWISAFLRTFKLGALKEGPQNQDFKEMWIKFETAILEPSKNGNRLTLNLDSERTTALLQPFVYLSQFYSDSKISAANLRAIAIALHSYHDAKKVLPAPANYDKQGKPLLSWRVHVLPYMDQEALYKQFKLDEPWDSEHNKKLIGQIPPVYRHFMGMGLAEGKTPYLLPVGKETVFPPGEKGLTFTDIAKGDGTSNTVMVLEVADDTMVVWSRPDDWQFDAKDPHRGLVDKNRPAFNIVFCDCSVQRFQNDLGAQSLKAYLTRNAGDWPEEFGKK